MKKDCRDSGIDRKTSLSILFMVEALCRVELVKRTLLGARYQLYTGTPLK
jgi:hypothetical protein